MSGIPAVSVLMPVFRPDPEYLRIAIESVRAQTLSDWELIVIEDPPASGAAQLIATFADDRIRHHLRTERQTLAHALNDGLSLCRSSLVARMDADDVSYPERLSAQLAHLTERRGPVAVGSQIVAIDGQGRDLGRRRLPTDSGEIAATLRRYNCVAHPSVMFRRDAVVAAGGYPLVHTEDYELWCRLVSEGHLIENLPDVLVAYRLHGGALKPAAVRASLREGVRIKKRYFGRLFTIRDRFRVWGEQVLLLLPPSLVLRLFRLIVFRRAS